MKLLKNIIGKKVAVYYNDISNSVAKIEGVLIDFDETELQIKEENKHSSSLTIIPKSKYIRLEVRE